MLENIMLKNTTASHLLPVASERYNIASLDLDFEFNKSSDPLAKSGNKRDVASRTKKVKNLNNFLNFRSVVCLLFTPVLFENILNFEASR